MVFLKQLIFLQLLFLLVTVHLYAQQEVEIDSLHIGLQASSTEEDTFYFLKEIYFFWLNNSYDSADVYAKKYYDFAVQVGNKEKESNGLNYLGIVFDYREDVPTAIDYYTKALEIRRELGDKRLIGNSLSNIGALYYHAGDYGKASKYYFDALTIREEIQDSSGLSQSYNNLGILLKNQGENEQALGYYLRSANLKKEIGREYSAMYTMLNIGSLYIQMEEYENAIRISEEAIEIAEKYQDQSSVASLKLNIGSALSSLNKFDEAEEKLKAGIKELNEVGETSSEMEGYIMLINNYLNAGNLLKAVEFVRFMEQREAEIKEPNVAQRFYQVAINVFLERNEFQKAYAYKVKEGTLKDSLFSETSKKAILELETQYQLSEKDQELAVLESKNTLNEVQISKANIIRNYTIFLALLLIVILVVIYKNYTVRERLNKKLQKNLTEKELLMKEIHHRVKNNLQIISSLLNIQSRAATNESASSALKESKNRVQSMALIHQRLYQKENITSVKVEEYVGHLLETLVNSFGLENRVVLNIDIQDLELDVDTTIPLGLIINELVTNAVKYAFSETEQGELSVMLKEIDNTLRLQIKDNGKGFSLDEQTASFGMNLVEMLSKKLEAELTVTNDNGTSIQLDIKNYKKAG